MEALGQFRDLLLQRLDAAVQVSQVGEHETAGARVAACRPPSLFARNACEPEGRASGVWNRSAAPHANLAYAVLDDRVDLELSCFCWTVVSVIELSVLHRGGFPAGSRAREACLPSLAG